MRSFHVKAGLTGFAVATLAVVAAQAFAASYVNYSLELGGDNHAAEWKAGQRVLMDRGSAANGQEFYNGEPLTWAVVLEAGGAHSQPGHDSDGYEVFGAANVVFNLELREGSENGPLVTSAQFASAINDGTNGDPTAASAFAISYNVGLATYGRLIDPRTSGGPRMEPIFTYPTAEPGKLIGQGSGYKEWNRTGTNTVKTAPGIGMVQMPDGSGGHVAGLGVVPVAEGQLDLSNLNLGTTYYLKVIPGNGNNVLRGDLNMLLSVDRPAFAVAANGTAGGSISFTVTDVPPCNGVVGRYVFYNNSAWDGNNPAANASDDAAIATDKTPLLPGGTATFANYISYSKGINGIMFDVCGMTSVPVANQDIFFLYGNVNDPTSWTDMAPDPAISIRYGAGVNGSDRVTLTWADNAIPDDRWLLVALFGAGVGLPGDDFFCFGDAGGETGNSPADAVVNATDFNGSRQNPHGPFNPAGVDDAYDINRDKLVNATDLNIIRANFNGPFNSLKLISWP